MNPRPPLAQRQPAGSDSDGKQLTIQVFSFLPGPKEPGPNLHLNRIITRLTEGRRQIED